MPFLLLFAILAIGVAGCGGTPPRPAPEQVPVTTTPKPSVPPPSAPKRSGGYYLDDGPGDNPPANLDTIPDAVPKAEALRPAANRPYEVFGKAYTPLTALKPYREKGVASWYGKRYHGQKTSSGETYDMYQMSAAHPTLPIPSYVRVTNVANGKSVVVRINDRGPFHSARVIDLSYVAAYKLGFAQAGQATVELCFEHRRKQRVLTLEVVV
jgi:rare lipoprotein A